MLSFFIKKAFRGGQKNEAIQYEKNALYHEPLCRSEEGQ